MHVVASEVGKPPGHNLLKKHEYGSRPHVSNSIKLLYVTLIQYNGLTKATFFQRGPCGMIMIDYYVRDD